MISLRILIVDDDASISILLAEILDAMGHVVCGFETTENGAVQAATELRPDLMLVDLNLREGSGVAAMASIGSTASIPYILMTGGHSPVLTGRGVTLRKPFMPRDLFAAVERMSGPARLAASA